MGMIIGPGRDGGTSGQVESGFGRCLGGFIFGRALELAPMVGGRCDDGQGVVDCIEIKSMLKKTEIITITLLAVWPIIPVLIGEVITVLFQCEVNEGGVQPCLAFGKDIGATLYGMMMMGWGLIATVPFAMVVLGTVLIFKFINFFLMKRQSTKNDL